LPWNKLRARARDKRPSIHLNISDIQYACSNTHHKDVTSIVFIGPQYARARARRRTAALRTDVELFPSAHCGFSTRAAAYVVG
jgi:hypothetical protein